MPKPTASSATGLRCRRTRSPPFSRSWTRRGLLMGAQLVCRSWRHLATADPTLWRRVDMSDLGDLLEPDEANAMARAAVDRAAGTMEAFVADSFVTDNLLHYMSQRASLLKSLQLSRCHMISNEGFSESIKGFPELEELDLTFCSLYGSVCETIGRACPQLKCFRINDHSSILHSEYVYKGMDDDIEALGIASTMPGLQDLQLIKNGLTNNGLTAILDSCPHLESLDIRNCSNIQLDDALKLKYARLRNIKLPNDPINDLKFQACILSSVARSGSYFEFYMMDDLLDVVTEDANADFDDMDDFEYDGGIFDDELGF